MEQLLIIEDDIGLNQGLSKALKADDRQIISCQDLKTAKEQLLCGGVSLILLDINLPDGSGLELLREVKENLPYVVSNKKERNEKTRASLGKIGSDNNESRPRFGI